jgi:hypothetical protein
MALIRAASCFCLSIATSAGIFSFAFCAVFVIAAIRRSARLRLCFVLRSLTVNGAPALVVRNPPWRHPVYGLDWFALVELVDLVELVALSCAALVAL